MPRQTQQQQGSERKGSDRVGSDSYSDHKQYTTALNLTKGYTLITGGAGFIGTNVAKRLLASGKRVLILDNLSRPGVEKNLHWLSTTFPSNLSVKVADIRDAKAVEECVRGAEEVFHFAAQVAVTTSLDDPGTDFAINANGTFNVLEAIRKRDVAPSLLFTSTNKVYGGLPDLDFVAGSSRYRPANERIERFGISEDRPLDFHSPYGCSKGAADQYVIDYARTFDIPAVVFRMSCIYGPHQHGTEDQGWIAHFLIRAIEEQPVTIYGDGLQVRDILFVEDLITAMQRAMELTKSREVNANAFNIGGGPNNTISLKELLLAIEELHGVGVPLEYGLARPGDQQYYVSDIRKAQRLLGWTPQVGVKEGVTRLYQWLLEYRGLAARAKTQVTREVSRSVIPHPRETSTAIGTRHEQRTSRATLIAPAPGTDRTSIASAANS